MHFRFPGLRLWLMVALFCVIVLAPLTVQRVKASAGGPTVAVIGDSITARYHDQPGDARPGWWSVVGRNYRVHVTTSAPSGSGFVRPALDSIVPMLLHRHGTLRHQPPRLSSFSRGPRAVAY